MPEEGLHHLLSCYKRTLSPLCEEPLLTIYQELNHQLKDPSPVDAMDRRIPYHLKGKGISRGYSPPPCKRIRAPEIDTSDLIKENALTLIGRLTNPTVQRLWSLIPFLSNRWNLKGNAIGSDDLGRGCFQFRFDYEEDMLKVLENRPYHFDQWMVILQKWEPVISASFPSKIPFWIELQGLPLHYWKIEMLHNIAEELRELLDLDLSPAAAKIKVLIDGLQPLVKETVIEFPDGTEAIVLLEPQLRPRTITMRKRRNHDLVRTPMKHLLKGNRAISISQKQHADDADMSGISTKATVEMMSREVGGPANLGFTDKDLRNYIYRKRMAAMKKGDAGAVLEYFQRKKVENASFFYSMQLDEDDMITNIFWADDRSISDYNLFGDVVCFDTTYKTNGYDRPFAPFVGVNHHKQTIVFGAALLYDETTESFEWLFQTFLGAMSGKQPQTILTDQCAAMANAIGKVFPETKHRLCVWHIYQNAAKRLSCVFHGADQFATDFGKCVFEHENEVEWLSAWNEMLEKHGLTENKWLKDLFELREKWAKVYGRHTFTADMMSTQRSESMNHILKQHLKRSFSLLRFFKHYERVLDDRRFKELTADFGMMHTSPVLSAPVEMLQHAVDVYTPEVYTLFEKEYTAIGDYVAKRVKKSEMVSAKYDVSFRGAGRNHLVDYVAANQTIHCSCMKFSFAGILCRHALKVLAKKDVRRIPPTYILNRWSKEAKARTISYYHSETPNDTVNQSIGKRYSHICRTFREIASVAAEHRELTLCADEAAFQLLEKLVEKKKELLKDNKWMLHTSDFELSEEEEEVLDARGIKRKNPPGRRKHQKVGRHGRYLNVLETKNRGISKSKKKLSFQDSTLPLDTQSSGVTTSPTLQNEPSFSQLLQGFDTSYGGSTCVCLDMTATLDFMVDNIGYEDRRSTKRKHEEERYVPRYSGERRSIEQRTPSGRRSPIRSLDYSRRSTPRDLRDHLQNRSKQYGSYGTPNLQWREKTQSNGHVRQDTSESSRTRRPPLERNYETVSEAQIPKVPTTETVMGELREVTIQYTSCADPTESAARKQRVIQGEARGMMAETAACIVASATHTTQADNPLLTEAFSQENIPAFDSTLVPDAPTDPIAVPAKKKRGRPPVNRSLNKSPLRLTGVKSQKKNLVLTQGSPKRRAGQEKHIPPREENIAESSRAGRAAKVTSAAVTNKSTKSFSLRAVSWNCCGLGNPITVRRLRDIYQKISPEILFLMETKNSDEMVLNKLDWMGYDSHVLVSPSSPGSGGLALFWKQSVEVETLYSCQNYIDTKITAKGRSFFATFLYGEPDMSKRLQVWNSLTTYTETRAEPWFLTGDFNDIIHSSEKRGGPPRTEWSFSDLRTFMSECDLYDLNYSGNFLSWRGQRYSHLVRCRLDRAMANSSWIEAYPSGRSEYLRFEGFDRRLRDNEELKPLIRDAWDYDPAAVVESRINKCRAVIIAWNKEKHLNSQKNIEELRLQLEEAMSSDTSTTEQISTINNKLLLAYQAEEEFWKQRSRQLWLTLEDKNTGYFHAATKGRKAINNCSVIEDETGQAFHEEEQIAQVISDYFQNLFRSQGDQGELRASIVEEAVTPCISQETNENLVRPPTPEEIRQACFAIHADKAPGPDAQLIPKITSPKKVLDFKPIALCSVYYKIIAKLLTKRLQPVLNNIISENQSAFVPQRAISDNVLITHETLHYLKTSKEKKRCFMAVKTDMSKAYDRLEWDFIQTVMEKQGFHSQWIHWIMQCVKTVSYSYLLNGTAKGLVTPQHGIRQGDPLSPYIFILCSEVLSGLCHRAQENGKLIGIRVATGSPRVNHLLFADDTMFFCRSDAKNCVELASILQKYETASGQKINFLKSAITFSVKTHKDIRERVKRTLNIQKEGGQGKYLGLPELFGRKKKDLFSMIVDRIKQRARSWSSRFLSSAGKRIMLKSVLAAMPTYTMTCFKVPASLCKRIQSVLTRFWWDANTEKKKMCWVAWKKLTRSVSDGKYCNQSTFLDCDVSTSASHGWRSICLGRDLLKTQLGKVIGNGASTSIWQDPWLSLSNPCTPMGPATETTKDLQVAHLMVSNTLEWDRTKIKTILPDYEKEILMIKPSKKGAVDKWVWLPTQTGEYSAKSGYFEAIKDEPIDHVSSVSSSFNWKAHIWTIKSSPKTKLLLWKAMMNALPVGDNLKNRNVTNSAKCPHCNADETVLHLFFHFGLGEGPLFPWIIWSIWSARNLKIFNNRQMEWKDILLQAITRAKEWQLAQSLKSQVSVPTKRSAALQLDPELIFCNSDAAWKDNNSAGFGWIFSSKTGRELRQGSSASDLVRSPLMAEAMAVLLAVQHAKTLGFTHLSIASDSLTLIKALNSELHIKELHGILHDILYHSLDFLVISFNFTPREANRAADTLAKDSLFAFNLDMV
ncbi:Reverse transcriptase domain [Arabidopsis suecica]|uniref:Reverse transcriptase domain n=1 Tax=Arabidopsis suecica TaxID=45249 RepID=A0A8T2AEB8_ARASU|nr:Reverse transcriptase domain [Arabidopsis suecica]